MKTTLLIIATCLIIDLVYAQDIRLQNLLATFEAIQDSLGFNGTIVTTQSDSMYFIGHAGYANKEFQIPVTAETKFRIASVSKPIISYAIYLLADQGKIDLNTHISNYLPELAEELAEQITIEHLIKHRSGLITDFKVIENGNSLMNYDKKDILRLINQSTLQSVPGEHYSYSNTGYTLLALIIENVQNQTLDESLKTLLFDPLGMNSTGHEKAGEVYAHFASGYDKLGKVVYKSSYEDKSHVYGAGSLFSTASDLTKFASEVIHGRLLKQKFHTEYVKEVGGNKTGGGWITWKYESKLKQNSEQGQILYFAGSCPGFRSFIGVYLEHDIVVIGLMNQVPINTSFLNNALGNIMLGYEPEKMHTPTFQLLLSKILTEDLDEVKAYYELFLNDLPYQPIKDYELNQIGYIFLDHHEIERAIRVFTFMTLIFPEKANAFDSLGEALIENGDIDEGLKAYATSLKLNPNNSNARVILERYGNEK